MTTEKIDQTNEHKGQSATTDCCSPQKFAEMMAKCGPDKEGGCSAMMQEMMKKGCCQPEQK